MNLWDILILLAVGAVPVLVSRLRKKRSGCSGGCEGCAFASSCSSCAECRKNGCRPEQEKTGKEKREER